MSSTLLGLTLLNQYHVEEFITLTPLGELHRATDTRSNKSLALTLLPQTISEDAEAMKRLEAESVKLRAISQANLVQYLGIHQTPTLAFLLEEWIDGPTLKNIFNNEPFTINEALIYLKAICSALEALHKQNYLHLNLAPELIHINQRGEIFLGGIGTARQAGAKAIQQNKYPPHYLSPEQINEQPPTPASDTYALAVILYELATGKWINGRSAPNSNETIRKTHLELIPPAPISLNKKIPDHFSRMLLWALRKRPEDRLKTTTELLTSLALAAQLSVDEVPLQATPTTAPVTAAILSEWSFLPPPRPNLLNQDLPPLEDRLSALTISQSGKTRPRIGIVPIFIFIIIAGFASLFWIVRPAPVVIAATPIRFTPFVVVYTPPPTFTPIPRPTDEHGGRIAFTCTRGDYNQICMINRDGTGLAQLTDMDASNYYPNFTPDGSSLIFASNRNGPFDLYLLVFGEKQLFQITTNVGNVISPDYSPDGRKIVFANRAGEGATSIWMVNADGLNPHLLYAGTDTIVAVDWSPDGEKIAYAMSVGIPQEYEIFIMDANGKNHVRISEGLRGIGGSLNWSPDGKNLLVYAGVFGDKNIFRIEVATREFTQLTDGGNNAGGVYSADGRFIVFNSQQNDDQADLYIMRADGENQQQLTNHPEPDWGPQWAP